MIPTPHPLDSLAPRLNRLWILSLWLDGLATWCGPLALLFSVLVAEYRLVAFLAHPPRLLIAVAGVGMATLLTFLKALGQTPARKDLVWAMDSLVGGGAFFISEQELPPATPHQNSWKGSAFVQAPEPRLPRLSLTALGKGCLWFIFPLALFHLPLPTSESFHPPEQAAVRKLAEELVKKVEELAAQGLLNEEHKRDLEQQLASLKKEGQYDSPFLEAKDNILEEMKRGITEEGAKFEESQRQIAELREKLAAGEGDPKTLGEALDKILQGLDETRDSDLRKSLEKVETEKKGLNEAPSDLKEKATTEMKEALRELEEQLARKGESARREAGKEGAPKKGGESESGESQGKPDGSGTAEDPGESPNSSTPQIFKDPGSSTPGEKPGGGEKKGSSPSTPGSNGEGEGEQKGGQDPSGKQPGKGGPSEGGGAAPLPLDPRDPTAAPPLRREYLKSRDILSLEEIREKRITLEPPEPEDAVDDPGTTPSGAKPSGKGEKLFHQGVPPRYHGTIKRYFQDTHTQQTQL